MYGGSALVLSMMQPQGFSLAFLIVFILLVVELGIVVSPFLPTILWAIILAQLAHPIYIKVLHRLHGRETVAATVVTLGVMVLAVAPAEVWRLTTSLRHGYRPGDSNRRENPYQNYRGLDGSASPSSVK